MAFQSNALSNVIKLKQKKPEDENTPGLVNNNKRYKPRRIRESE